MLYDYTNFLNFSNACLAIFLGCALLFVAAFALGSNPVSTSGRRVVIYARYSTDKQRDTSIDDQVRTARIHLDKLGIAHEDAIVLYDKEISGERSDRKNYLKVLELIRNQEVAILASDEISRFARGPEMGMAAVEMELYGTRFITADGHDSLHDPHGLMATIKGGIAGVANRELAHRVRRGIAGRVLDGNGADGTHPFGYSSRYCDLEEERRYQGVGPKPKKEVFINEVEATVVLEIFTMYANGMSQSEIARNLNARQIPLGAQSNRRAGNGKTYQNGWHKTLIGRILKQRKYIGLWIWGEFMHRKNSIGKRIIRPSDPHDVVRSDRPELAIVPMELWDRVQERLKRNREKHAFKEGQKKRGPRTHHSEEYPSNLLSGLLFCGVCGSKMHVAMGKSGMYYRCPIALHNGKAGGEKQCEQRGWVPYDRAVAALTDYLRQELQNCRDWVDDVYSAAIAEHRRLDSSLPDEVDTVKAKLAETGKAIDNMVSLVESGTPTPAILERLNTREAEKRELEAVLGRLERRIAKETDLPNVEWVKTQLENLPDVLAEEPRKAALFFRKFFGKVFAYIVVAPGKKRGHAEIAFKASRLSAMLDVLGDGWVDASVVDCAEVTALDGDKVRIPLAGNDKLDNLMPTIDAMVRAGKTWRDIEAELKINRSWANRYYRIWKSAIAG